MNATYQYYKDVKELDFVLIALYTDGGFPASWVEANDTLRMHSLVWSIRQLHAGACPYTTSDGAHTSHRTDF